MLFNWLEYKALAEYVAQLDIKNRSFSQESLYRCAISRIYYASFCSIRSKAEKRINYKRCKEDAHKHLIDFLSKYGNQECKEISQELDRLRQFRVDSDYIDERILNIDIKYKTALSSAENIINKQF